VEACPCAFLIIAPWRVTIKRHAPAALHCTNNPKNPLHQRLGGSESARTLCKTENVCPSWLRSGNICGIPNDMLKNTGITDFKFILLFKLLRKLKDNINAKVCTYILCCTSKTQGIEPHEWLLHLTYNELVLCVPCKLDHSVLVMVCGGVKWKSSIHVHHSARK